MVIEGIPKSFQQLAEDTDRGRQTILSREGVPKFCSHDQESPRK